MNTIAVINQKGGVGKSTTAQAIGAGLILKGYSVLFVDLFNGILMLLGAAKACLDTQANNAIVD